MKTKANKKTKKELTKSEIIKFTKLINSGWKITVYPQLKRVHDASGAGDWDVRVCWSADDDIKKIEGEWKGFTDSIEAIKDLTKTLKLKHEK